MWSDFAVIHDLACQPHHPEWRSPAQLDDEEREEELAFWADDPPILALSYATVGGRAFNFPLGHLRRSGNSPAQDLTSIWSKFRGGKPRTTYPMAFVTEHVRAVRSACRKGFHIVRVLGEAPALPLGMGQRRHCQHRVHVLARRRNVWSWLTTWISLATTSW